MDSNVDLWEKVYEWNMQNKNYMIYPDEDVIRIIKKYFLPSGSKRVLDAGCGSGRHTIALLREGLDVTAVDTSDTGLEILDHLVSKDKFHVKISKSSITKLPFNDNHFDAVLCWGVLHYLNESERDAAMVELSRVLKPGGYIGLTLRSTEDSECHSAKRGVKSSAYESREMVFDYFNEDDLQSALKSFKIINYGHKTYTVFEDRNRKIAHWFIVAQK